MSRNMARGVLSGVFGLLPKTLTISNERQFCVFVYESGSGREERFEEVSE